MLFINQWVYSCNAVAFFSCLWMLLEPIVQHTDNFPFLSKLIYNIKQTKDAQDEGDEELNKVCVNITCTPSCSHINMRTHTHTHTHTHMHTRAHTHTHAHTRTHHTYACTHTRTDTQHTHAHVDFSICTIVIEIICNM